MRSYIISVYSLILLVALSKYMATCFKGNQEKAQNRLWVETGSSNRGWNADFGNCQNTDGVRRPNHGTPLGLASAGTSCKGEEPSVTRGWTMSSGVTKEIHYPRPGEGLVLLIFNQRDGSLLLQKVFPLGHYWFYWSDFQRYFTSIEPGRLVIMTVSVAGCLGLRQTTQALARLGSLLAPHLTHEAHWTWVFIKGGRTISETAVVTNQNAVHQHATFSLNDSPDPRLSAKSSLEKLRWQFCATEGSMGSLCDEHSPQALPIPIPPSLGAAANAALANVPILLTAGNRHHYLRHTLSSILTTPGIQVKNLHVVLGDVTPSTTKLLNLLNVKFTILPVSGYYNNKLFMYYRSVYEYAARKFVDAKTVILLDEDVEVSPDFFSYMSQTLWLLEKDPSLYCVNAFSAFGNREVSQHPSRLLRGAVQVEWGYAITLDFVKEALSIWPKAAKGIKIILYDYFLYTFVSKGRECVYPEIGRSFHYGAGMNTMTNLITMERSFLTKPMVHDYGVKLSNVERLLLPNWELDLKTNISRAIPLVGNPCKGDLIPRSHPKTNDNSSSADLYSYAFYYHLDAEELEGRVIPDVTYFYHLYNCLGAWSLSEQGQHKGVGILSLSPEVTLYLVGDPFSPYSNLRPDWVPVWNVNEIPEHEFEIVDENRLQRHKFTVKLVNENITEFDIIKTLSIS